MVRKFVSPKNRKLAISPKFQVLGPFQSGTRGMKAVWGADPLELFGGFRALEYDKEASFESSLGPKGLVSWSETYSLRHLSDDSAVEVELKFRFSDIDWRAHREVYGWCALQFQAWARGFIDVTSTGISTFELYAEPVLEIWVDDVHYFGCDFYEYRRAPIIVNLTEGRHRLDIRLIRDGRAMGSIGDPVVEMQLQIRAVTDVLTLGRGILMGDTVGGLLTSQYGCLTSVCNAGNRNINILSLESASDGITVMLLSSTQIALLPGQSRSIPFRISLGRSYDDTLQIKLTFCEEGQDRLQTASFRHLLQARSIDEPQKMTFLHPSGVVSYAMIRPPLIGEPLYGCTKEDRLPVMIGLHGANVEASSKEVSHSMDGVSDLPVWTVLPNGVTSWSGDDWHQWGFADLQAAANAIPDWIKNVMWQGPGVDPHKWFVVGHSNGGQGTWYALTHKPDQIIAAAPVSGYSSIQKYLPYLFWREADPRRTAVVQAATNSYRHELLLANSSGIPVFLQHGREDDNVPCFHARRMNQLKTESNVPLEYSELSGIGHWFPTVMTTPELRKFYKLHLGKDTSPTADFFPFTLVVANPADTGSKFGFRVEELVDPGQLGKLRVTCNYSQLSIQASNVERFTVPSYAIEDKSLVVNDQEIALNEGHKIEIALCKCESGFTEQNPQIDDVDLKRRVGNQLGPMDAILRTRGSFVITYRDAFSKDVALQISRNLFQYFAADTSILSSNDKFQRVENHQGNEITIGTGGSIPPGYLVDHPVQLDASEVRITKDASGTERRYCAKDQGLAAVFLRPLSCQRLELVVWGSTKSDLALAARLVPTVTGAGQPDFVVLTRECLWKGIEGTLAMGFLDSTWSVSKSSFLS